MAGSAPRTSTTTQQPTRRLHHRRVRQSSAVHRPVRDIHTHQLRSEIMKYFSQSFHRKWMTISIFMTLYDNQVFSYFTIDSYAGHPGWGLSLTVLPGQWQNFRPPGAFIRLLASFSRPTQPSHTLLYTQPPNSSIFCRFI